MTRSSGYSDLSPGRTRSLWEHAAKYSRNHYRGSVQSNSSQYTPSCTKVFWYLHLTFIFNLPTCTPQYPPATWYRLHAFSTCQRDISSQPRYRRLTPESSDFSTKTPLRWAPKRGRLQRIATASGKELQTQRTKHRHAQLSWLSSKKNQIDFRKSKRLPNSCSILMFLILAFITLKLRWSEVARCSHFFVIPSTKALSAPALRCIFQQSRKSKKKKGISLK